MTMIGPRPNVAPQGMQGADHSVAAAAAVAPGQQRAMLVRDEASGAQRELALHIVTALDFGGVESHMAMLGQLRGAGRYDHAFCAIASGGRVAGTLRASGAEVDCLRAPPRIPSPVALWRLVRLLRRRRPAVVHAHGAEANFHGLIAARLAGVPVRVGEEIGIPGHGRLATGVFRVAYACAQAVVGVSQSVTDWLVRSREVKRIRATTLLNPVALPTGRGGVVPPGDRLRMCFVGRFEPVKNPIAMLDAFTALVESGADVELWLAGEGSLGPQLERMADAAGLGQRIRFFGYHPAPAELLRQCHVCVQPSLSEGFGLALVEAMGCEVAVLSTRVGIAPEVVVDGASGWLVDGFDAAAILAAMQRAYRMPRADVLAMGGTARRAVVSLFDPRDYLARLESLYDTLATTGRPR